MPNTWYQETIVHKQLTMGANIQSNNPKKYPILGLFLCYLRGYFWGFGYIFRVFGYYF